MTIDAEQMIQEILPETKWYLVMKPFEGETGKLVSGEVVDTTNWLHTRSLMNNRYIAPIPVGITIPEPEEWTDGVMRRIYRPPNAIDASGTPDTAKRPTPTRKK